MQTKKFLLPTEFLNSKYGILLQENFEVYYDKLKNFLIVLEKKGYLIKPVRNFSIYDSNFNFIARIQVVKENTPYFKIVVEGKFGKTYVKSSKILSISQRFQLTNGPKQIYAKANLANGLDNLANVI